MGCLHQSRSSIEKVNKWESTEEEKKRKKSSSRFYYNKKWTLPLVRDLISGSSPRSSRRGCSPFAPRSHGVFVWSFVPVECDVKRNREMFVFRSRWDSFRRRAHQNEVKNKSTRKKKRKNEQREMITSYLDDQKRSPVLVERQGHDEIYFSLVMYKSGRLGSFCKWRSFCFKREKKNANKSLILFRANFFFLACDICLH